MRPEHQLQSREKSTMTKKHLSSIHYYLVYFMYSYNYERLFLFLNPCALFSVLDQATLLGSQHIFPQIEEKKEVWESDLPALLHQLILTLTCQLMMFTVRCRNDDQTQHPSRRPSSNNNSSNNSDHDGPFTCGRGSGRDTSQRDISTDGTNLSPSAETHISCLWNGARTTSSQQTEAEFTGISAIFCKLFSANFLKM